MMTALKTCDIIDCTGKRYVKGHCQYHYNKSRVTPEYTAWAGIKQRCYNSNRADYKEYYQNRGIKMCDEWLHDFNAFYDYIGKRPTPLHSVDRIDNDGDYEPGNVKWSTRREQSANTRNKNKYGHPGIYKRNSTKLGDGWVARMTYKGKLLYLGTFSNIDDAIEARRLAETTIVDLSTL